MNTITFLDLTLALNGLEKHRYAEVLNCIRTVKGMSPLPQDPAELAIRQQHALVHELRELYAQVNVSRLALEKLGQDETDSAAAVLLLAGNRLYELTEEQHIRAQALERAAHPEDAPEPQP